MLMLSNYRYGHEQSWQSKCMQLDNPSLTSQEKLHHDYKVEVPIKCLNGKLYVRISAHIYNMLEDYQKLAIAIRNLP